MFATQASQNVSGSFEEYKELASLQYLHPLAVRVVGTPRHCHCVYPETQVAIGLESTRRQKYLSEPNGLPARLF
jgi:hypothetical protein